jgi:N-formylglutamate deformylase
MTAPRGTPPGAGHSAGDSADDSADVPAFSLHRGHTPLLLSLPHVGLHVPPDLAPRLHPRAVQVEDADRHLERLYDFARGLGASVLVPRAARYVIDLNRPREDTPMYPGVNNTGLLPLRFFTGEPLYRDGCEPDAAEREQRIARWWQPYHDALAGELARLKALHGHALLWDGHSIRSRLPWLFDGALPALNLGTADGRSCAPALRTALAAALAQACTASGHTHVVDGRFKGGHITRHYGRPGEGVHAVQMEMVWSCCMAEDPPWDWDEPAAARVRPVLQRLLQVMLDFRP